MVLLPSDYYEASILQMRVTEPCTYSGHASTEQSVYMLQCLGLFYYHLAVLENSNNPVFVCFYVSCLLYQHLPLGRFSCVLGSEAVYFRHGGEYRRIPVRQPTPDQPVMTHISGREVRFLLLIAVPSALLTINLLH